MAISDRNVSTVTQAGATPLVVTKPTGVISGDVLVASFIAVGTVHTTLAGWTEIGFQAEGTSAGLTILRKVAGGSEPANYSFVNSGGLVSGAMIALIGVDNTTPEDATSTSGTGTGTTLTAPTITTVTDNAWWMTFFATDGTQASLSQPSGFTVDVASFTDSAGDVQRVDHSVITPAGPTGTTTSTSTSGGWMAISVAIRPAASTASIHTPKPLAFQLLGSRTSRVLGGSAVSALQIQRIQSAGWRPILASGAVQITAAITASVAVAATNTEAVAVTGAIAPSAAVAGTNAEAVAETAPLTASAAVAATNVEAVALTAAITASAAVASTDTKAVAITAALAPSAVVAATNAEAVALSAPLTASAAVSSTNTESVAETAPLTASAAITGTATEAVALTAAITASAAVAGAITASGGGALSAALTGTVVISGVNTELVALNAALSASGTLAGANTVTGLVVLGRPQITSPVNGPQTLPGMVGLSQPVTGPMTNPQSSPITDPVDGPRTS